MFLLSNILATYMCVLNIISPYKTFLLSINSIEQHAGAESTLTHFNLTHAFF